MRQREHVEHALSGSPADEFEDARTLATSPIVQGLSRNRFLTRLGTVAFGVLASQAVGVPAWAHRSTPPRCCGPSGQCNCCSGDQCCGGCSARNSGCGSSGYGWYCCNIGGDGRYYFCRDWWDADDHKCICAGLYSRIPCA